MAQLSLRIHSAQSRERRACAQSLELQMSVLRGVHAGLVSYASAQQERVIVEQMHLMALNGSGRDENRNMREETSISV